jgi:hypothetical protein
MKSSSATGNVIRWASLTMLGLAAGIITAFWLDRPIEAVVGMMLVTPILTLLAGAILGSSQWIQLRSLLSHTRLWILATCVGLGIGLALGVVTVEQVGRLLTGHRPHLIQLSAFARAISFAVLGTITGLSVGTAQWIIVLRRHLQAREWIATSTISLGIAFATSSLIVDIIVGGIASPLGSISFLLFAGLIFGVGTARPLLRAT